MMPPGLVELEKLGVARQQKGGATVDNWQL